MMAKRIERLYAWVMTEPDGGEGIPGMQHGPGVWGPMIGADRERVESYRELAREMQHRLGLPVRLVCFERRVDLERLNDA